MGNAVILAVEDERLVVEILSIILEQEEYSLLQANTAEDGIDLAISEHPDLIIMDIQLPGMDGLEATKILKEDSKTADIPIVVLSAQAMQTDIERAHLAGCDGYITKPFEVQDLLNEIKHIMRRESS